MSTPIVLVIDADPSVHDIVAEALAEEECVLLGARSELVAIQLSMRRAASVVVIDASTVSSPADLLRQLQRRAPNLRALVMVDGADNAAAPRLSSIGPVLPKPLDPDRLRLAVRNLVRLAALAGEVAQAREDLGATHAVWRRIATTRTSARR